MSIELPRSPRSLHFTGSVKALGPQSTAPALGQERPRVPPPLPPVRYTTPVVIAEPAPVRAQLASMDDDLDTQSIDKEAIEAALFPIARRPVAPAAPCLPVPHFRTAEEARQHHAPLAKIVRPPQARGALPLGVWLALAVIAGVVSFNLAPQAAKSITAVATRAP